jgi:hypothetical protein
MNAPTSADPARQSHRSTGHRLQGRSAAAWFVAAAIGQTAFIWMIIAHYGVKTLAGDPAGWNEKPLIKGHVAGGSTGNMMFAAHVLLAALVTAGGLLQLLPALRHRVPAAHRRIGRMFLSLSMVMALSGLWLTWVRGTYLSPVSAIAVSVDGVLILAFAALAWQSALKRDFVAHRRWALRTFMVVSGVWFLRVGIMAWVLLSDGGVGMNDSLSGPADILLQFGAYLVPLALLEAHFHANASGEPAVRRAVAGLILVMTLVMLIGIAGAISLMWWPYM